MTKQTPELVLEKRFDWIHDSNRFSPHSFVDLWQGESLTAEGNFPLPFEHSLDLVIKENLHRICHANTLHVGKQPESLTIVTTIPKLTLIFW